MSFYAPFSQIVQEFVNVGALVSITIIRRTGAFNPRTATTDTTDEMLTGFGVVSVLKTRASDGTIKSTNVAKMTIEPKIGDTLRIGPMTYTIDEVSTIAPDGNAIFYEAIVS